MQSEPGPSVLNDPTAPTRMTYQPEWRQEDEARMARLERLYFLDGRKHLPDGHPLKGTYTGLHQKYLERGW
jgi:hypothetical protein